MTVMLLVGLGLGCGLGLALLAVWLVPPRPALGPQLTRIVTPATASASAQLPSAAGRAGRWRMLGPVAGILRSAGLPTKTITRDLALLERPVADYLTQKTVHTLAGLLVPPLSALALWGLGLEIGVRIPAVAAFGCGVVGFLIVDHRVRTQATQRRTDFRHALSAFLDLVVISLAGGAGVDSALTDAARLGNGWAFTQLQRTLTIARLTRTTPWAALRQLGNDLGIPELSELAASIALAGTEGAKVRQSLRAKAAALRARQITEAESRAAADTERMSLPVMALFLGFLCFITYPAMSQVLAGLS